MLTSLSQEGEDREGIASLEKSVDKAGDGTGK